MPVEEEALPGRSSSLAHSGRSVFQSAVEGEDPTNDWSRGDDIDVNALPTLREQRGGVISGPLVASREASFESSSAWSPTSSRGSTRRTKNRRRKAKKLLREQLSGQPYLSSLPWNDPEPDFPSIEGRLKVRTVQKDKTRQLHVLHTQHPLARPSDKANISIAADLGSWESGTHYGSLGHRAPDVNYKLELAGKW